jgi:hypothetical protein
MTKKEIQLIDDLMSVATIMDEVFRFHPENPKQVNVVEYYNELKSKKVEIENELQKISEQEKVS